MYDGHCLDTIQAMEVASSWTRYVRENRVGPLFVTMFGMHVMKCEG